MTATLALTAVIFVLPASASEPDAAYGGLLDNVNKEALVDAVGNGARPANGGDGPQDRYFRADHSTCVEDDESNQFDEPRWFTVLGGCPENVHEFVVIPAPCDEGAVEVPAL